MAFPKAGPKTRTSRRPLFWLNSGDSGALLGTKVKANSRHCLTVPLLGILSRGHQENQLACCRVFSVQDFQDRVQNTRSVARVDSLLVEIGPTRSWKATATAGGRQFRGEAGPLCGPHFLPNFPLWLSTDTSCNTWRLFEPAATAAHCKVQKDLSSNCSHRDSPLAHTAPTVVF